MTPYFADDLVTLHHGDCLDVLRELPDASVDAVVTDPPYGLEFMGREWDRPDRMGKVSEPGQADGTPFRRNTGTPAWGASGNPVCLNCGGTKYDRTRDNGCACDAPRFPNHMAGQMRTFQAWCEAWAVECLRVLKPGGHLLAFGGSRTWHRLASAVEDAGFEVRDSIAWLYGQGFPKSLDVGKAIDKAEAAVADAAASWEGWGTALKPAFEPIVVARKPLIGTVATNVLRHGTGALNIDGCRTAGEPIVTFDRIPGDRSREEWRTGTGENRGTVDRGRWPANVVLDESQAAALDEQSGVTKSGSRSAGTYRGLGYMGGPEAAYPAVDGDTGGASRFFYCAKAPVRERVKIDGVAHPTVKPLTLMRWLVRLVTPPGGTVLEPFAGSGTTAEACVIEGFRCIAIEREASYLPLIVARLVRREPDLFGEAAS